MSTKKSIKWRGIPKSGSRKRGGDEKYKIIKEKFIKKYILWENIVTL